MERAHIIYGIYLLFFAALTASFFIVPLLAFNHDETGTYVIFSSLCHQKISRSLCVFSNGNGYWIGDCTPQNGKFVETTTDRTQIKVSDGSVVGYKMPMCSRDLGIYGAMLLGSIVYPFVRKINSTEVWPAIFLIAAIVPLALDGTVQLVSDLGFLPFVYESTNSIRLITGAIAGLVAAFYALPILVGMFGKKK